MESTHERGLFSFVVYPGFSPLELIGPMTALNQITGARRKSVVGRAPGPIASNASLSVLPDTRYAEAPSPQCLVIPGGGFGSLLALADEALLSYLRRAAPQAEVVLAVGTGSLLLAAAGLIRGREATTALGYEDLLSRLGARPLQRNMVWDGTYWTAAGASSAIEAGIALAQHFGGGYRASLAQMIIEYDPSPPDRAFNIRSGKVDPLPLRPDQLQELRAALSDNPGTRDEVEAWLRQPAAA
jgi:transcriptional regulator GlxA family with amidase domain